MKYKNLYNSEETSTFLEMCFRNLALVLRQECMLHHKIGYNFNLHIVIEQYYGIPCSFNVVTQTWKITKKLMEEFIWCDPVYM